MRAPLGRNDPDGIEDHAVRHAIARVALLHQAVHEDLAIRLGETRQSPAYLTRPLAYASS